MPDNIANIKDCYGCGLCSIVCKHNAIDIEQSNDGFYQPSLNSKKCISCGLCTKVCAYINLQKSYEAIHCYAAWSKDASTRNSSTSGGVSFEIAKKLFESGYKFCGVRYNLKLERAEHYIANDVVSLQQSKGSKYLQSFTRDAFMQIDRKQKHLIVGTPCQIASFRRYLDIYRCADNFILIDFFCHGVPSYLLWKKYLLETTKGIGTIESISWRNKIKGWHKSYCITIEGDLKSIHSWNGSDDFFTMFLGDACLNKACFENCKFKYNHSSADIRIGDFLGDMYKKNEEGVCSAIAFTERGNKALCEANLELVEYPFDTVADGQMKQNPHKPWYYDKCMRELKKNEKKLADIAKPVRMYKSFCGHLNRLKKILHL